MNIRLLEPSELSHGARYGAEVEGIRVLRTRSTWMVHPEDATRIWNQVVAECPPAEGEKVRMGSRPACNYYGPITERQCLTYGERTKPLVKAASRFMKPQRDAEKARSVSRRRQSEIAQATFYLKVGA